MNASNEDPFTQNSSRSGQYWVSRVGRAIGWSGWMTAGAVVLLLAGLTLAVGLPIERIRWWVLAVVLFCGAMHFAARFLLISRLTAFARNFLQRQPSAGSEEEKPKGTTWQQIVGTTIGVVCLGLFVLYGPPIGRHDRGGYPKGDFSERQLAEMRESGLRAHHRAKATSNYWRLALIPLYRVKFAPLDENERTFGLYARVLGEWTATVQRIRSVSTQNVDDDLATMVRRHIEADERFLQRIEQLQQTYPDAFKSPPQDLGLTFGDVEPLLLDLADAKNRGELADAPEPLRAMINEFIAVDELHANHYAEIEIMQARLQERYRPYRFALPQLELAATVDGN